MKDPLVTDIVDSGIEGAKYAKLELISHHRVVGVGEQVWQELAVWTLKWSRYVH